MLFAFSGLLLLRLKREGLRLHGSSTDAANQVRIGGDGVGVGNGVNFEAGVAKHHKPSTLAPVLLRKWIGPSVIVGTFQVPATVTTNTSSKLEVPALNKVNH